MLGSDSILSPRHIASQRLGTYLNWGIKFAICDDGGKLYPSTNASKVTPSTRSLFLRSFQISAIPIYAHITALVGRMAQVNAAYANASRRVFRTLCGGICLLSAGE